MSTPGMFWLTDGTREQFLQHGIIPSESHLADPCSLCGQAYRDPAKISCGHTFCDVCIRQHFSSEVGNVRCPYCKQLSIMPNTSSTSLVLPRTAMNYDAINKALFQFKLTLDDGPRALGKATFGLSAWNCALRDAADFFAGYLHKEISLPTQPFHFTFTKPAVDAHMAVLAKMVPMLASARGCPYHDNAVKRWARIVGAARSVLEPFADSKFCGKEEDGTCAIKITSLICAELKRLGEDVACNDFLATFDGRRPDSCPLESAQDVRAMLADYFLAVGNRESVRMAAEKSRKVAYKVANRLKVAVKVFKNLA